MRYSNLPPDHGFLKQRAARWQYRPWYDNFIVALVVAVSVPLLGLAGILAIGYFVLPVEKAELIANDVIILPDYSGEFNVKLYASRNRLRIRIGTVATVAWRELPEGAWWPVVIDHRFRSNLSASAFDAGMTEGNILYLSLKRKVFCWSRDNGQTWLLNKPTR